MIQFALSHRKLDTIKKGVLTVAAFDKFHPVSFYQDGKFDGIEVTIMEEYAKAVGLQVKFVRVAIWDGIWDKPRLKEADVSIGGISNSFGRTHKDTEWSMPYYYVKRSVITLKKPNKTAKFKPVSAIPKSSGYLDTYWRSGEIMLSMTDGRGYIKDLERLRKGKLKGIMYGDNVSRAILKENPKKDLAMRTWSIVPTLVPTDGETFSFPTRMGSGIAVSLTSFLTYAAESGLLVKLCKQYHLKYPVVPVESPYRTEINGKKHRSLKQLLRLFLLSPDRAEVRKKFAGIIKSLYHRLASLFDAHEQSVPRVARLKEAFKRGDVVDHALFLNYFNLVLSDLSYLISPDLNNTLLDFIVFETSAEKAPLVVYSNNTGYINTTLAMQHVRTQGNNKKAFFDEIVEISKLLVMQILEKESGVKDVSSVSF